MDTFGYIMAYEETQNDVVIKVEILNRNQNIITVKNCASGEIEDINEEEFFLLDEEAENGCEDLAELKSFNEAVLLINLQSRFAKKSIYTKLYSGLIVLNPYSGSSKLTSKKNIKKYWKNSKNNRKPHIFQVAKNAFENLKSSSQVILISGESGAGKTESTKHVIQFLASREASLLDIEQKLIGCSPILESFGNAKTLKNNNSSRFGKFIKLYYSENSENIISASIDSFLLEKSRVTSHAAGEKTFHIFYLFLKHLIPSVLNDLSLTSDYTKYKYLLPSPPQKPEFSHENSQDGQSSFEEILSSFQLNGFTPTEIQGVWKTLAGILHIGNLEFEDKDFDENTPCVVSDLVHAENAAKVLEVSIYDLISSITTVKRTIDRSEIVSPVKKNICENLRDTLAKHLYGRLFSWIVFKLNQGLKGKEGPFIGILDIFGFEVFKKNSFEQLCINLANEKLQQLSIDYTFKSEIEEFRQEDLADHIPSIEFSDNQPVLDLLEQSPNGLFQLTDEASSVKSSDEVLLSNIKKKHKENSLFSTPKTQSLLFTISHTASPVTYSVESFVSKNIDEVRPEFDSMLQSSLNKALRGVFKGDSSKGKFIGEKFRKEISLLMQEIAETNCWFVRCIKTNEEKAAWVFDQRIVLNQIQYLGLLDSIMIRKKGFPVRMTHRVFAEKYKVIKDIPFSETVDPFKLALELRIEAKNEALLVGKTKVFMKPDIEKILDQLKKDKTLPLERAAGQIQGWFRVKLASFHLKKMRNSAKKIQKFWKGKSDRRKFLRFKEKVLKIQRWYKSVLYREQAAVREFGLQIFYQYLKIKIEDIFLEKCFNLAIKTQKLYRGYRVRKLLKGKKTIMKVLNKRVYRPAFRKILNESKQIAAIRIQKTFRGWFVRSKTTFILTEKLRINKRERMALRIQKWFRGEIVRKKLRKIQKSSIKIQTFFKSKIAKFNYKKTLKSITTVQRAARSFIFKTKAIKSKLSDFLTRESALLQNLSLLENSELFSAKKQEESIFKSLSNLDSQKDQVSSQSKVTPFHVEKIYFCSKILDLEVLSDQSIVYESIWSKQIENLAKDLSAKDEHIMDISAGSSHTLALTSRGRVFAWGWNDKNQCMSASLKPRALEIPKEIKFTQISSADDHSLTLTSTGQIFAFGDNSKGQLGQSNYLDYKSGVFLDIPPCKQVAAVNSQNMAVTVNGELFIWPFETAFGERRSYPMRMLNDCSVQEVSVGFNFAMILTSTGVLYSLGSANLYGQLGHGDNLPRASPTLILLLKKCGEKIANVVCGQSHVVAKSSLGKVFTWGLGDVGQLGHGNNSNELCPRMVALKNTKVIQIAAGQKSSVFMLENRKIWLSGRSSLGVKSSFSELNVNSKLVELNKQNEFAIVKIGGFWSRGFSAVLVTLADLRFVQGSSKIMNGISALSAKWSYRGIEPPPVESISGYFPTGLGKKIQGKQFSQKLVSSKQSFDEMRDKIGEILKKSEDKWSVEEKRTMEYVSKIRN